MIVLKNLAESFITSAISETATEITIPADHTDLFPSLFEGDNFRAALVNPATKATEFINVTARNGNVLTVVRGEEGVAALPFPVESRIHLRMTAKTWEEMAGECWMRPKDVSGEMVIPQFVDSNHFSLAGDYRDFFKTNRAIKAYPNLSVGFVESAVFADNITTVRVIEMVVPDTLSHIEAGLDPDALAKRTLSNEELLGYMTPVPVLTMEALEVDGGTLVHGTISHPENGKVYPDSTEFHFSLPENVTDFELTGLNFKLRVPVVTEENSPQSVGPITCRAAQMSLILSNSSNAVTLSVRYVAIKAGVTLGYADTQSGYPNADVNNEGAKLPACTVGLNNPSGKSIVSGRPEFEIMGAELPFVGTPTTTSFETSKKVNEGNILLIAGYGECAAGKVTQSDLTDNLLPTFTASKLTLSNERYTQDGVTIWGDNFDYCAEHNWEPWRVADGIQPTDKYDNGSINFGSIYVEFEAEKIVTSFVLKSGNPYYPNSTSPSWKIYTSGDGVAWSLIKDITLPVFSTSNDTQKIILDSPITSKFLKLTGYGHSGTQALGELQIAGRSGYYVDISSAGLTSAPTKAFKKLTIGATIGTGATDEPINQETELTLGEGSTTSSIVLISDTSIKDKIYNDDSIHKNIKCDGQDVAVESVSEAVATGPEEQKIPVMSAETTDGCTITADDAVGAAWKVGYESVGGSGWTSSTSPHDLIVEHTKAFAMSSYALTAPNNATNMVHYQPITWNVYGSTNKTDWTLIDSHTNVPAWSIAERRVYTVATPAVYKYHKYNCLKSTGGTQIGIGKLEMFGKTIVTKTTVNLSTPLANIPTTVALPSCFTIPSAIESCTISGSALKFTGAKVDISDPAVKRLALKVIGDDSLRVKAAKIYTEEGA